MLNESKNFVARNQDHGGRGMHLTIGDYVVSIQFGAGMYCSNHNCPFDNTTPFESDTAEIAIIHKSTNEFVTQKFIPDASDDVIGYVTSLGVAKIIKCVLDNTTISSKDIEENFND